MKSANFYPVSASLAVLVKPAESPTDLSVLTVKRDDYDWLSCSGQWELMGGGVEIKDFFAETVLGAAAVCACREAQEEVNVTIDESTIVWQAAYLVRPPGGYYTFNVAHAAMDEIADFRLGDEGTDCRLMPVQTFLELDNAVAFHQQRLRDYLAGGSTEALWVRDLSKVH